jgi:hypothetical protein
MCECCQWVAGCASHVEVTNTPVNYEVGTHGLIKNVVTKYLLKLSYGGNILETKV